MYLDTMRDTDLLISNNQSLTNIFNYFKGIKIGVYNL